MQVSVWRHGSSSPLQVSMASGVWQAVWMDWPNSLAVFAAVGHSRVPHGRSVMLMVVSWTTTLQPWKP